MNIASSPADQEWPPHAFETVDSCPWCESQRLAPAIAGVRDWFFDAVPGEFEFATCQDCGSLVLGRRPTSEYLAGAYSNYYTHADTATAKSPSNGLANRVKSAISSAYVRSRYSGSGSSVDAALARFYSLFVERCREIDVYYRFLPEQPGKVLDFGCGNGTFLERAREKGHSVFGVDFDPGAIDAAAQKGITVMLPDDVENVLANGPFDHVSAAHVIEHVDTPKQLLSQLRRWMKPGATLFLELPNANADGLARFGPYWRGLEAPRHFSLPTRSTLRSALHEAGFADVEYHCRAGVAGWLGAESAAARDANAGSAQPTPADENTDGEEEFLTVTAQAI